MKSATKRVLKIESSKNNSFEVVTVTNSEIVDKFVRQFYSDDLTLFESFFLCLLDRKNDIIGWAKISQGGISGITVDPVLVAKYAIDSLASSVILCHNHPSGNLKPSKSDIELTKKIKAGLKLFNIQTLDHIILTENSYYSFNDNSMI